MPPALSPEKDKDDQAERRRKRGETRVRGLRTLITIVGLSTGVSKSISIYILYI
jgi:hypothetical protein